MVERFDEEKLELLGRWGDGLVADPREEVRAAGRAILMLIEELQRLQVELGSERSPHGVPSEATTQRPASPTFSRASAPGLRSSVGGARPEPRASPPDSPTSGAYTPSNAAVADASASRTAWARLTALITARSDAVAMLEWRPTPQSVSSSTSTST